MTDSFQQLKLMQSIGLADSSQASEACQQRLLAALDAVGSHHAPGEGDIASLVRDVLRREDEKADNLNAKSLDYLLGLTKRFGSKAVWAFWIRTQLHNRKSYYIAYLCSNLLHLRHS